MNPFGNQAYYTNESFAGVSGGFHIARVVKGQPGYYRSRVTWPTIEEARAEVDRLNKVLYGLTPQQALEIVATSFAVPR